MTDLGWFIRDGRHRSIAVPALGCGLGGLNWPIVYSMLGAWSHTLPGIELTVYSPEPPR